MEFEVAFVEEPHLKTVQAGLAEGVTTPFGHLFQAPTPTPCWQNEILFEYFQKVHLGAGAPFSHSALVPALEARLHGVVVEIPATIRAECVAGVAVQVM